MTTGKTIALTIWTFVGNMMSLLFNILSRFLIAFLPRRMCFFNFMDAITICIYFRAQENKICHCFPLFPHLFAMKWWDWMPWSVFWMLSFKPGFHPSPSAFSLSQHPDLSNELVVHLRWPKYWSLSFSICPSNEYSGLISFRIDWFDLPRDSQESSPTPQFKSINSFALCLLYGSTLTSILGY